MRGHFIGLPKLLILLGMAVMAMSAVFMVRSFASHQQPGEAIPDSIAAMLRGGTCYSRTSFSCTTGKKQCLTGKKDCVKITKMMVYQFEQSSFGMEKPAGTNLCCGNAGVSCTDVWTGSDNCGTGG